MIRSDIQAALAALLLSLTLASCNRRDASATAVDTGAAADTLVVGAENVAVAASDQLQSGPAISGTLRAEREAQLRAEVSGPVLQTYVEPGQRVTRGALLVRLDDTGVRDQFLSARSAVATARTSHEMAERELQRARRLVAAGAIAERDVEQAERAAMTASTQLEDARARLALAQRQLDNTRITAPFAGVVGDRPASAGDIVQPGTSLVTVIDPSSMRLDASVPAERLGEVQLGAAVVFSVSGYPDRTFNGRVTRLNPSADPVTRQVRLIASIPNAGRALVAGLHAEGRVASRARTALVIPASAVDRRGSATNPTVLRLQAGRVQRVQVALGIVDEASERVEVRSGLAPGDTVLLGGAMSVAEGSRVRVTPLVDRTRQAR